MEEEKQFLTSVEKSPFSQRLSDEFFVQVADGYETRWPNLIAVGFDVPAFINAAKGVRDIGLFLNTWEQSLEYANFAWSNPATVKDNEGKPIRIPHTWISGCFKRSSHYPRPINYRTPEEIAQEQANQAALKAHAEQEEERFSRAFKEWRSQHPEAELRQMSKWNFDTSIPEAHLRNTFRELVWSQLEKQKIQQPGE